MKLARSISLVLLTLVTLIVCSSWLATRFIFPGNIVKQTKFTHLQKHGDEYDALFIGSSRFHRQITPEQFDEQVGKAGFRIQSYNAAEGGMYAPESYFFIRKVLELRPKRLRYLFVEPMEMVLEPDDSNADSLRFVSWHDWETTRDVWSAVQASRGALPDKQKQLYLHGRSFLERSFALGFASAALGDQTKANNASSSNLVSLIEANRGWVSLDSEVAGKPRAKRRAAAFQGKLPEYRGMLTTLREAPKKLPRARKTDVQTLTRLVKQLERSHVQVIYLIPPNITRQDRELNLAERVGRGPILNFADPDRYPELYDENVRFDFEHLNAEGAARFTRLLAARFAEYLQTHPPAP